MTPNRRREARPAPTQRTGRGRRRVLVGGADRDVDQIRSEIHHFRTATASFNALREDMTDLRDRIDTGFAQIRGTLDATATGQQQIVDLVANLIGDRPVTTPADRAHDVGMAAGPTAARMWRWPVLPT